MLEPDNISRSIEDQLFIAEVESAITNDLREQGIFAEIIWHQQTTESFTFRFVADPNLCDLEDIVAALDKPNTQSSQLEISKPYVEDDYLLVHVKRLTPGPLYTSDSEDNESE